MPAAGVAYDGSLWVTAASSVALVVGTVSLVAVGGSLAARRAREGALTLPTMGQSHTSVGPGRGQRVSGTAQRSQPLQKQITEVPKGPEEVDSISE